MATIISAGRLRSVRPAPQNPPIEPDRPTISNISVVPTGIIPLNTEITLTVFASGDPTPLSYQWQQTAGPLIEASDTANSSITFTATLSGTYTFSITVSDALNRSTLVYKSVAVVPPAPIEKKIIDYLNSALSNKSEVKFIYPAYDVPIVNRIPTNFTKIGVVSRATSIGNISSVSDYTENKTTWMVGGPWTEGSPTRYFHDTLLPTIASSEYGVTDVKFVGPNGADDPYSSALNGNALNTAPGILVTNSHGTTIYYPSKDSENVITNYGLLLATRQNGEYLFFGAGINSEMTDACQFVYDNYLTFFAGKTGLGWLVVSEYSGGFKTLVPSTTNTKIVALTSCGSEPPKAPDQNPSYWTSGSGYLSMGPSLRLEGENIRRILPDGQETTIIKYRIFALVDSSLITGDFANFESTLESWTNPISGQLSSGILDWEQTQGPSASVSREDVLYIGPFSKTRQIVNNEAVWEDSIYRWIEGYTTLTVTSAPGTRLSSPIKFKCTLTSLRCNWYAQESGSYQNRWNIRANVDLQVFDPPISELFGEVTVHASLPPICYYSYICDPFIPENVVTYCFCLTSDFTTSYDTYDPEDPSSALSFFWSTVRYQTPSFVETNTQRADFGDPWSARTTVSFPAVGYYYLRVTCTNAIGQSVVSDLGPIHVGGSSSWYEFNWTENVGANLVPRTVWPTEYLPTANIPFIVVATTGEAVSLDLGLDNCPSYLQNPNQIYYFGNFSITGNVRRINRTIVTDSETGYAIYDQYGNFQHIWEIGTYGGPWGDYYNTINFNAPETPGVYQIDIVGLTTGSSSRLFVVVEAP